jgi:hypothetical protein
VSHSVQPLPAAGRPLRKSPLARQCRQRPTPPQRDTAGSATVTAARHWRQRRSHHGAAPPAAGRSAGCRWAALRTRSNSINYSDSGAVVVWEKQGSGAPASAAVIAKVARLAVDFFSILPLLLGPGWIPSSRAALPRSRPRCLKTRGRHPGREAKIVTDHGPLSVTRAAVLSHRPLLVHGPLLVHRTHPSTGDCPQAVLRKRTTCIEPPVLPMPSLLLPLPAPAPPGPLLCGTTVKHTRRRIIVLCCCHGHDDAPPVPVVICVCCCRYRHRVVCAVNFKRTPWFHVSRKQKRHVE